jgi:hypothetical protein
MEEAVVIIFVLSQRFMRDSICLLGKGSPRPIYMDEERRKLHKKFIWLVPFVGPLLIAGFWRKAKKVKFDTMTKQQRDKNKGDFYESGIGLDS